ncbi:hypothetical protein H8Z76_07545 [Roseburia sp. BX0805]|uniref:ATPase involved in DNA repair n=1 Tax=Roseburia yibonii TaxID=2763063 RepID=A0ABR7IAA6_9FIRM|nr:hypothetical protein [Roseburia yibonii]MBC5753881.1 hypothetical protein [Roseburia yibonii]
MFEKGSEWRRWDLHVHTPNTKKNDNYKGDTVEEKWKNFYSAIETYINSTDERKKVSAIGITDYLAIDNYNKVVSDGILVKDELAIFPNVEMRITPMGKKSPVNIHFIFNPDFVDKLENRFFGRLEFEYGRKYHATKSDLIELGKSMGIEDNEEAYKKGIEQFVPSYTAISNLFKDDVELRENTLIGVANGSSDGASGINKGEGGDQLSLTRFAVYKMCDFIFSSSDNDINYFLGKGVDSEEEVKAKCGSLKPCFHGSDAHCIERLFEPDNSRYCWIKSDTTFNGLKQVIYEPEARVRIGELKPEEKADYYVIDKVVINEDGFSDEPIEFNDKLTCIIGGKSTGKSLLLQNIARAIDNRQVEEKINISRVPSRELNNVSVFWKDGDINNNGNFDETHKIVYIPQTYLNRLTDEGEKTSEIDRIIQDIVLLDPRAKNAFEKMENDVKMYKPSLDKKIYDMLQAYSEMTSIIQERNEIGTESGIRKEIEKLKMQKEIISKETSISEEELKKFDEAIKKISVLESVIRNAIEEIGLVKDMSLPVEKTNILGKFSEDTFKIILDFQEEILEQAGNKWNVKKDEIVSKLLFTKVDAEGKREEALKVKSELEQKVIENEALTKLSEQIKNEESKLEVVLNATQKCNAKKKEYEEKLDEVSNAINAYKEIHNNYANVVNENAETNSDGLDFSVGIQFKNDAFCSFIKESINNNSLKRIGIAFDDKFRGEIFTKELLRDIIDKLVKEELKLLKNKTIESVLRDILSDWYLVSYNVKLENDSINQMSPGKKALVLLKLLISMADSKCPILIDQPEDDLDNRSIFDELIPFIRKKKVERQIIVVTHNANVVLGGDAEEIIVANQDGNNSPNYKFKFEYRSGSIENSTIVYENDGTIRKGVLNEKGIQQHICDILEGGERAFDLRKHKYSI